MFSVTSHVRKTVIHRPVWTKRGQITLFLAFAVVFGAALLSLSHGGPQDVKWSQVKGVVQETRIVADRALETKWGGQLTWKAEYKVGYSVAGHDYAVWVDSGIRGEDQDAIRIRLPKSTPSCRVRYNPQSPVRSTADCF